MADSGSKGNNDDCSVEQAFIAIPDLLVVRPVSLAGCAVGFTAFVVTSPFTAMA
ncbi:MAG: multidrug transporter, partial [Verrucomicrobia bacterium]|nr:multidrug transporter [Verrucomicrobiota bacterium]